VAAQKGADQNVGVIDALIMVSAGAPDGTDFLDNLRFGQWALVGAQAYLIDDREDVIPGAFAALG